MKNIGIVCEGPTDHIILKNVIDTVTSDVHHYFQLQPEPDLTGIYGNGWKGVWKWCRDNAKIKDRLMKDIKPALDILVIQMDGDVSRKERSAHCWCDSTVCRYQGMKDPLICDIPDKTQATCPITLPCKDHADTISGYTNHLKNLIGIWFDDLDDTCIVIPCDSTEAWVVAAYDGLQDVESIKDPWTDIIAKKKYYHGIRISGDKKRVRVYEQFADMVCTNWKQVTDSCLSAREFEHKIHSLFSPYFLHQSDI